MTRSVRVRRAVAALALAPAAALVGCDGAPETPATPAPAASAEAEGQPEFLPKLPPPRKKAVVEFQ